MNAVSKLPGVLALIVALFLIPVHAAAQTRSLRGIVSDQNGIAVSGAVVKLKNTATLHIRSYITGKDGAYAFHGLNPDIEYQVWASHRDRTSNRKSLSRFDSSKDPVINLSLK